MTTYSTDPRLTGDNISTLDQFLNSIAGGINSIGGAIRNVQAQGQLVKTGAGADVFASRVTPTVSDGMIGLGLIALVVLVFAIVEFE